MTDEKTPEQIELEALRSQSLVKDAEIRGLNKRLGKYVAALQAISNVVQAISD